MKNNSLAYIGLFLIVPALTNAQSKICAYFNHPVDTALASFGMNAAYLPSGTMADTIVAYINRAQHTLDIAQYDYTQDTYYGAYANIATAVNNAYARGVIVRWVYDASESNTGMRSLNSAIPRIGRPASSSGIMHNKFIVIDAGDGNPNDAIVCTGSPDWSSEMFYKDYNNILFLQDSALAYAYTAEFNIMWGSTTDTPNAALAEFGPAKPALGLNMFTIAGHEVELYFSPADNTDAHLASTILTASKDLYVGVYDMTRTNDAHNIVTAKENGAYTLAVVDQYTPATSSDVNAILSSGLGTDYVVYTGTYIYHNKMMVVDATDTCSDPIVETGSHNWTSSATEYNDENVVIVHNDTLANLYYQSVAQDFMTIGNGTISATPGCGAIIEETPRVAKQPVTFTVYPVPTTGIINISYSLPDAMLCNITIYDMFGRAVSVFANNDVQAAGTHEYKYETNIPGIYFVTAILGNQKNEQKVVVTE